jgi:hypothetical protein
VWPYYVTFGAFLDSALLVLGFMIWGYKIDDTETTRQTATCRYVCGYYAPCPCCDGSQAGSANLGHSHHGGGGSHGHSSGASASHHGHAGGHGYTSGPSGSHHGGSPTFDSARTLGDIVIILIVYILAMVFFSVLMVSVGVAIRKINVLYDRYAQRVLDHCKESVGELVVIGRDDFTAGALEASFGQPSLRLFETEGTVRTDNSQMV